LSRSTPSQNFSIFLLELKVIWPALQDLFDSSMMKMIEDLALWLITEALLPEDLQNIWML
jgi:hypothetical protein